MESFIFLESYLLRTAIPPSSLGSVQVTSVFNSKPQRTKKSLIFTMVKKYHPIDLTWFSKKTQTYCYSYFLHFDFQLVNTSFLNMLIVRIKAVLHFPGHLSLSLEGRYFECNFVCSTTIIKEEILQLIQLTKGLKNSGAALTFPCSWNNLKINLSSGSQN